MQNVMIVTGGSRGIGAATARLAGERGYAVLVNYHSDSHAADEVVGAVCENGGRAIAMQGDVGSEDDVISLFDRATAEFGPVTTLINNAGILETASPLAEMSVERISRVIHINVVGAMICAREAVRRMAISRGGSGGIIVNLSSIAARLGGPHEFTDYAASKGAIETLTRGLALETAADGIRVNAVQPGLIYTDIHASSGTVDRVDQLKHNVPMQRGGTAEEVAEAILWLASDQASYTTGSFVEVSGGR